MRGKAEEIRSAWTRAMGKRWKRDQSPKTRRAGFSEILSSENQLISS